MVLGSALAHGLPEAVGLRFADLAPAALPSPIPFAAPEPDAPAGPAADWLRQQGWEQAWPKLWFGQGRE